MTYIILAAGKGNNLQPLTLKYAKTSYKLDENTTVLQSLVRSIRRADKNAEIVVVVGYKAEDIKKELDGENVIFVKNPFYEVTNSIRLHPGCSLHHNAPWPWRSGVPCRCGSGTYRS